LKDNWENLEAVAHIWQPDAYLTNVTVNVAEQRHFPIEEEYRSNNSLNETRINSVDKTGKITSFSFPTNKTQSFPLEQELKFDQLDWLIDSQEALRVFAESFQEIYSCLSKPSDTQILLMLNRAFTENITW
jgi:hypothetical protein